MAFHVLQTLCPDLVVHRGDPAALVSLLSALPDETHVHAAIWVRAGRSPMDIPLQDAWAAAGAIEAACVSLTRHAAADEVLTSMACHTLFLLTERHAANQARAGMAGAAEVLMAALAAWPASTIVGQGAVAALCNLMAVPANVSRVVAAGQMSALARVLHDGRMESRIPSGVAATGSPHVPGAPAVGQQPIADGLAGGLVSAASVLAAPAPLPMTAPGARSLPPSTRTGSKRFKL